MAENIRKKIQLYRTSQSGTTASDVVIGELAMNYNSNSPFVMFKDNIGDIQKLGALSEVTGSSVYHTMTQKAITDAIYLSNSNTSEQFDKIETSIGLAEDGSYVANENAYFISDATSLNDADLKLDAALKLHITVPSDYSVVYPTIDGISGIEFLNTVADDTVLESLEKVDSNVALLVEETLKNENVIAAAITEIKESVGLDENLKYVKNTSANYIQNATSFSDADNLLDDAIKAEVIARENAISNLSFASIEGLDDEIATRQRIEGQNGTAYTKNDTSNYISDATSLNDADLKLDAALKLHITVPSDYSVVYPTTDEISGIEFLNTVANDTVLESLEKVDSNVALLVEETLKNENVIAVAITELKESVGLDENLKYVKNTSANYIQNATSFGDADNLLDDAIKAEVIARENAISNLSSVSREGLNDEIVTRQRIEGQNGTAYTKNDTSNYISDATSLNDADLKLDAALKLHVTVPSDYSVVYPTTDETDGIEFLNTVANDTVLESLEKVDSNVALLVEETLKNENVVADAITKVKESVGLNANLKYVKNTSANYIQNATSFGDADNLLDDAIKAEVIARENAIDDIKSQMAEIELSYYNGHNTISSLTSLPITKRLCIATISSSQTLGVDGQLADGKEIHIIIKNNSSDTITITIPSTMVNMTDENLEIGGGKYGEINLVSDGTNIYYRGAA